MTFYTFMTRNYIKSDCPQGDLARDMRRNKESFPRNRPCKFKGWQAIIHDYLTSHNACRECLEAFEISWKEYVQCVKNR